MLGLLLNKS